MGLSEQGLGVLHVPGYQAMVFSHLWPRQGKLACPFPYTVISIWVDCIHRKTQMNFLANPGDAHYVRESHQRYQDDQ